MKPGAYAKYIFLLMIFFFGLFVIFYNKHTAHRLTHEMERHAVVIEDDLWTLDLEGARSYLSLASERDNYAKIIIDGLPGRKAFSLEGPKLQALDYFLDQIGFFPKTIISAEVKHDGEIIGQLIVHHRNLNIYTHFYVLVMFLLAYFVLVLFLKTNYDKQQVEIRVQERTTELTNEIDERKRIEERLKQHQYYLSKAQELGKIGTWELDLGLNRFIWTDENCRIFGVPPGSVVNYEIFLDKVHPDDREYVDREWKAAIDGKPYDIDHRILVDGHIRWVREKADVDFSKDGEDLKAVGFTQDITVRKQTEEQLYRTEEELKIRNNISYVFLTTPDNELYGEVLQVVLKALKSPYGTFAYIDENGDRVVPSMTRDIWEKCKMANKTLFFPRKNWKPNSLWARCILEKKTVSSNGPFKIPEGHLSVARAIATPIIHRGEVIGNFMVGDKGTNYDEKDTDNLELIANHTAPILYARLQQEREELKLKQAEEYKAKLEGQLQQSQKMEAIGTLAGGIAHDFNNILGIIVGNTELAMDDIPGWNPAHYNLEEVRKASLRARDMVKQILSFSRQTKQEAKPVRIKTIIEEALKLIRSSIPTIIEIRQNYSAQADTILADPTQINQVLMNLCTNANHAMREKGGILEIGLKNIDLDEKDVIRYQNITPGKYVALSVSDTGHGIEPDIVDRILDPYFTTKEIDEGTGMGLAVVHGIVKNHNGAIDVYSEHGKGTTFNVLLPLIQSEILPEAISSKPLPTGTERILFVDDEKALADLGKRMLERLGYDVTVRTRSIEALEAFRAQPDKYDLLLTDMTMPNMTGKDLAQELLRIRPDFPIILCTGYSETITEDSARQFGIKSFVMKPLVMREIAVTIRQVLDPKKE